MDPNYPQQPPQPAMAGFDPNAPGQTTAYPNAGVNGPGVTPLPPPKANTNSTQNALLISEIRDGIVIMNDGSFRAVVMCRSINFDLMSGPEKDGVEYSFQGFLNSLYFPVQIFIRSTKIDIRPYIEKLDKIRSEHDNMLLAYLMEDYIDFISSVAQQTNIMDKKFYVVVPFYPPASGDKIKQASKGFLTTLFGEKQQVVVINEDDLEKAKAELRNRVQTIMAGLQQCGVASMPLDTQELIELYYDAYNPDTATRQKLKNFNDLAAPVVTKGEGFAANPNLDRESAS